jgi:uncharacterized Zn finger protein
LYDTVELAALTARAASQPKSAAKGPRQTQVSEEVYRKQIKNIFKHSRYDEYDEYDEYGETPAYVEELEEVRQTAVKFLEAGDAEGALIILRVLLEKITEEYDSNMDENGDLACVVQDIGMPLAEAILSLDLDAKAHQKLRAALLEIYENLDESIEESELAVVIAALDYGWKALPDRETQWEEYEEEEWMVLDDLQAAHLNVLERQGRADEFLQLAQKVDICRYTLKLLQLGRVEAAISASQGLTYDSEMFQVAQSLHTAGRLAEALALAERGLALKSNPAIAAWLAPLEEAQGRSDMALRAYRVAFEAQPSMDLYRRLKGLAGPTWDDLRPQLLQKISEGHGRSLLVDIHLEEQEWEAAIAAAERDTWATEQLAKVAEALIPFRPDWVIRVSLKQAEALIAPTQSNLYPAAAEWLARAKKAYQHKGQFSDWLAYISNLRATYARRPSLQKVLAGL